MSGSKLALPPKTSLGQLIPFSASQEPEGIQVALAGYRRNSQLFIFIRGFCDFLQHTNLHNSVRPCGRTPSPTTIDRGAPDTHYSPAHLVISFRPFPLTRSLCPYADTL